MAAAMAAQAIPGIAGMFGGGGDEYEPAEFRAERFPEWMRPQYMQGRPGEILTERLPQYPWAEPLLGGGAQYLQNIMGAVGRGEVPGYLTKMAEAIRGPAVAELETGFGRAAGLMGETLAGRGMKLAGGAGQAGARALGGEFARARGGLEQDISRQMFGETAGLARALPQWLGTYGQIRPPVATMGVQPFEKWYTPGVAGFVGGGGQMAGGDSGGFDIGQALPWLMAGRQTPTQSQYGQYGLMGPGAGSAFPGRQNPWELEQEWLRTPQIGGFVDPTIYGERGLPGVFY